MNRGRLDLDLVDGFTRAGLLCFLRFLGCHFFAHVDASNKTSAIFHDDSRTVDVAFDFGAVREGNNALAVDVAEELPFNDDGTRVNIGLDAALFANCQMFLGVTM